MAATYELSKELAELGQKVIEANIRFAHLKDPDCRIAYQYSDQQKTSRDKTVYADTQKIDPKLKAMIQYDFVITFYRPNTLALSPEKMEKLMYHELCHVGYNGKGEYSIIPHDVEDFRNILETWGFDWI